MGHNHDTRDSGTATTAGSYPAASGSTPDPATDMEPALDQITRISQESGLYDDRIDPTELDRLMADIAEESITDTMRGDTS